MMTVRTWEANGLIFILNTPNATFVAVAVSYAPRVGALAVRLPEPKEKMMNDNLFCAICALTMPAAGALLAMWLIFIVPTYFEGRR